MSNTVKNDNNILNLDDFRKAAALKRQHDAMDARFTPKQCKTLEKAFEFGRKRGVYGSSNLDNSRSGAFFYIRPADITHNGMTLYKHAVSGKIRFGSNYGEPGHIRSCDNFKALIASIYDHARSVTPAQQNTNTPPRP